MFFNCIALTSAMLAGTSMAGTLLWDGRFSDYTSASDLDNWSWSNQVGEYQWYIHGDGNTTDYVNLDASYANPADTSSTKGAKLTIDSTSTWEGQTMLRTELIPQTSAAIGEGKKFYHFSLKHATTNAPDDSVEHQVAFFESHFTELKISQGNSSLQWFADSTSQYSLDFEAGVWHNIAYGIDFDAGTVEFFHSTGADDLVSKAGPVSCTASSNGADFHVGILRLAGSSTTEDWYFSGVYIEEGDMTTSVSGPTNGTSTSSTTEASSSVVASSSAAITSSSAVVASSSAAVTSSSAAVVSTQAAVVASSSAVVASSSAAPTTLQTQVRSTSSSATATTAATSEASISVMSYTSVGSSSYSSLPEPSVLAASSTAEVSAEETGSAGECAVEYVYV